MAYVPNPTDPTQPVESVLAQTAAAEFRALKAYIQSIVSGGGLGVATPGQIALFTGTTPLPGWLELDGSLQLRGTYPNLWANAQLLGNIVTEATWAVGGFGSYSSGDLATNFRLPDARGMFIRGFNHGRVDPATDPGRVAGMSQAASRIWDNGGTPGTIVVPQTANTVGNPDQTQSVPGASYNTVGGAAANSNANFNSIRPINIPMMYCVKT